MASSRLHSAYESQMQRAACVAKETQQHKLELSAAFAQLPCDAQHQQQPHHASHQRICLEPKEIYSHIAEAGEAKHTAPCLRELVLGVLAGCFIGFGFSTCMLAAGQMDPKTRDPGLFNLLFGAYGFPVGLSMCVINGASLFTSNIAYMMSAFMERKVSGPRCLFIVWLSYFTNLAGCLLLAGLMVSGHVFAHREEFTIALAIKKTSSGFSATLVKGILCNWLVCMAVWQGNAAQDITGKLLGIWFPISAFVTMGFEHCIANMYVIPLAIMLGAPLTPADFIVKNLIPSTIGNLIGGGFFVATSYGLAFGAWGELISAGAGRLWAQCAPARLQKALGGGSAPDGSGSSSGSSDLLQAKVFGGHMLPTTRLSPAGPAAAAGV